MGLTNTVENLDFNDKDGTVACSVSEEDEFGLYNYKIDVKLGAVGDVGYVFGKWTIEQNAEEVTSAAYPVKNIKSITPVFKKQEVPSVTGNVIYADGNPFPADSDLYVVCLGITGSIDNPSFYQGSIEQIEDYSGEVSTTYELEVPKDMIVGLVIFGSKNYQNFGAVY